MHFRFTNFGVAAFYGFSNCDLTRSVSTKLELASDFLLYFLSSGGFGFYIT